ncbi:serine/threonine-protein kinase [Brevibacillus massiliensis]|uniref:serine/threonine-protein kinase n=1 Tax=Brevibacillus massiliensis TaxID=1118054 RepID=UPI000312F1D5|nr:serine/threonine-protein kinase [Brevibacillus massiliensis]
MKVISKIEVEKLQRIGADQGRNSRVYLAYDPQLNGTIALKEISVAELEERQEEFFAEAQRLYANKHPRVAPILYACKDDQFIRMAMPYFKNGSLQDILEKQPLTTRKIIEWSQQFLTGLHYVHINGFIHFDVKPTNLLIHDDGSLMLTDFGQTRETDEMGVANNPRIYTWHRAPEQLIQRRSTLLSDIYQAGLTLYRMCNGEKYLDAQKSKYLTPEGFFDKFAFIPALQEGKFPDRQKFLPHVPSRLRRVIRKSLNVDPASRYQTALELALALGQVSELLDWQYEETEIGVKWTENTITHQNEIEILFNDKDNKWHVQGRVVNLANFSSRKKSAWCGGPFRSFKLAEKYVDGLFREMEGKKR